MNDLVVNNNVVIPVVYRRGASGQAKNLVCELSGWDNNTWDLQNWFKEG
jgi:peptide/nickel transport system substrate-binding protein